MNELFQTENTVYVLAPQDEAMETFRKFSKFSPLTCYVMPDGLEMRYKLRNLKSVDQALLDARLVIEVFNLPLHAELDVFRINERFICAATLILKYTGK